MYVLGPVKAIEKGATRSNNAAQQMPEFPHSTSHRQVVPEAKTEHEFHEKSAGFKPTVNSVVD